MSNTPRTDEIRANVMAGRWNLVETGGLLEKLETFELELIESQAREHSLREALEGIPDETLMVHAAWKRIENALSLPPPPCIHLSDEEALVEALEQIHMANTGGNPVLTYQAMEDIAAKALATFRTKHPTP